MQEKTCCFIGHSEICHPDLQKRVFIEVEGLINKGVCEFLNGGMGTFDWICAKAIQEFKVKYPHIKNNLIIPYISFKCEGASMFDEIIYPELEEYHYKSAIIYRNRYLVKYSKYALCYINHSWGGAAKTFEYASKRGLIIHNIGKVLNPMQTQKTSITPNERTDLYGTHR